MARCSRHQTFTWNKVHLSSMSSWLNPQPVFGDYAFRISTTHYLPLWYMLILSVHTGRTFRHSPRPTFEYRWNLCAYYWDHSYLHESLTHLGNVGGLIYWIIPCPGYISFARRKEKISVAKLLIGCTQYVQELCIRFGSPFGMFWCGLKSLTILCAMRLLIYVY